MNNLCVNNPFLKCLFPANRVVEVNEMWRLREKQLDLDSRLRGKRHEKITSGRGHGDIFVSQRTSNTGRNENEPNASSSDSSKTRTFHDRIPMEGEGLRDDEVDEFLQSRSLVSLICYER